MGKKIFIFFGFLVLVLVGLVFWFFQRNAYSKEILKLEILGPETVEAGEEMEYILKYKNNGNVRLEDLELIFEYPEGSLPIEQDSGRIVRELEDLYPGQEEVLTFRVRLFGKEGDVKTANTLLSYRAKNLKPFYESKSTSSTKIDKVPITFSFDLPSKIVIGKETKVSLNYFSSFDYPLSDLGIKIEYPQDFEFIESRPIGIEKNEWQIVMLNKAEGGRIEVFGRVSSGVGQQKIFQAQLGVWIEDKFVLLKEIHHGLEVVKPRLIISQTINGLSEYIASPGDFLHYEIYFRNVGNDLLEKLFLVSNLEGPFDLETINSPRGRINLSDGSIFWDWRNVSRLEFLGPGEEGKVEFWVNAKDDFGKDEVLPRNPVLKNSLSLSQIEEEFETKVSAKIEVVQKGFFEDEIFGNSGPLPPRVGDETTYTIMWHAHNYYNDIKNAKVRATLPKGVELTGRVFPEEEKSRFTFDSASREILWNIGDLRANEGTSSSPRTLGFQIALRPSENQKGLVVTLVNEARISGEDQFTERNLNSSSAAIDTTLPDDPAVDSSQGVVE